MSKAAWVVVGLGYGDEGKGTIVDALVRKTGARTVVRFNGGCQAAHNVVAPDGRHHTFSQWGAGTLAGARTILTKDFILSPLALENEARHLSLKGVPDPMSLVTVDERALLVTPYHAVVNQTRELVRGGGAHGSCGVGIGEAVADAIEDKDVLRAGDLLNESTLRAKLDRLRAAKHAEAALLCESSLEAQISYASRRDFFTFLFNIYNEEVFKLIVASMLDVGKQISIAHFAAIAGRLEDEDRRYGEKDLVLEGAQGVLLDEWHGFHPHTTWSTTTSENARAFLATAGDYDATVVGVTRSYATRHGAGPFPTEITGAGPPRGEHNAAHPWQGNFRVGHFDQVAARYAIESDSCVDAIAVTCCDQEIAPGPRMMCVAYEHDRGRVLKLEARRYHGKDKARLEEQRKLGEFLRAAKPRYEPLSNGPGDTAAGAIARELGKPLLVESRGPTCEDKVWKGNP